MNHRRFKALSYVGRNIQLLLNIIRIILFNGVHVHSYSYTWSNENSNFLIRIGFLRQILNHFEFPITDIRLHMQQLQIRLTNFYSSYYSFICQIKVASINEIMKTNKIVIFQTVKTCLISLDLDTNKRPFRRE